jgi:hypothetical protein
MRQTRNGLLFVAAGAITGVVSAIFAIDMAGSVPAGGNTAWRVWEHTSVSDADPYALAHYLLRGQLPPPAPQMTEFFRVRDDGGAKLDSSCTYLLAGKPPPARWWSLSAGPSDGDGSSVSLASSDAAIEVDGGLAIRLSRHPQPGNWLELPDAGLLALRFTLAGTTASETPAPDMTLTRTEC